LTKKNGKVVPIRVNVESDKPKMEDRVEHTDSGHEKAAEIKPGEADVAPEPEEKGPVWYELSEQEKQSHILDVVTRITPKDRNPLEHLEKLSVERDQFHDNWLRAAADMDNYKKRTLKERSQLLKYGNEDLLRALLPIVDNMDRALNYCNDQAEDDPLAEGVCMIEGMLQQLLDRFGVKPIEALDQQFDPTVHEAIARTPMPGKGENMVVEVLERGYMYRDRLLRPAKVVVSTNAESGTDQTDKKDN
jgi:molecular chaperone GrpE